MPDALVSAPKSIPRKPPPMADLAEPMDYFLRLQSMVNAFSSARTLDEVAAVITHHALSIMGTAIGMVVLLSKDGTMFDTLVLEGVDSRWQTYWKQFPTSSPTPLTAAVTERRPIVFKSKADFVADFPGFSRSRGFQDGAVLSVPMLLGNQVTGAIGLSYRDVRSFSEWEIAFLETAAAQCAQAIDRARLLEEQRRSAETTAQQSANQTLRGIVDGITDSVAAYSKDLKLLAYNTSYERAFQSATGRHVGVGMDLMDTIVQLPNEIARYSSLWARVFAGETFTVIRESGNENCAAQFFETSYSGIRDDAGAITGAVQVSRNVTERVQTEAAFQKTAAQLKEAQSVAKLGSWVLDVASQRMEWSEEMFRVLDIDPAHGTPSLDEQIDCYEPVPGAARDTAITDAIRFGTPFDLDSRLRVVPGAPDKWLHRTGSVKKNEKGEVERVFGVVMDITVRKMAEKAQERLLAILDRTSDYISTITPTGVFYYCNRAFRDFLGVTEAAALLLHDTVAYTDVSVVKRNVEVVPILLSTGSWNGDVTLVSGEGKEVPVSLKAFAYNDSSGKAMYYSTIARDISEQKDTEEALRTAQERLEEAQHAAHFGSWELDIATGKLMLSKEFRRIAGLDPLTPVPTYSALLLLYVPEDAIRLDTAVKRAISEAVAYELDVLRLSPDGSVRSFRAIGKPTVDACGHVTKLTHTSMDITEHQALEKQLLHAQKMETIGRFAGTIAHDFNNLLAIMMGHAELIADGILDKPQFDESVKSIQNAVDRGAHLTHQLLAFAHNQANHPVIVQPNELLVGMTSMLRPLLGQSIELITNYGPDMGNILVDEDQLEQVIVNLVVNARDAMPNGGRLTLAKEDTVVGEEGHKDLIPAGPYIVITVSDTGTGMTKETQERLFEPFFTTKEKGKGTGLGLATVYGIVKQNAGFISVHSELGNGTNFKVYLPAHDEAVDGGAAPEAAPMARTGTETVLVVDDEAMLRNLMVAALRKQGYHVYEAAEGGEALAILEKHPNEVRLVVTDVIMPGMGGLELARRLRETNPEIRVLLVSGYAEEIFKADAISQDRMPLLKKPFRTRELIERVHNLLAQQEPPHREAHAGDIDIAR